MYRIIKDNGQITLQDKPTYVRRNPKNGLVVGCPKAVAQGLVAGDIIYHLAGRPGLPGFETITMEEFDGAAALTEMRSDLESVLAEARAGLVPVPTPGMEWNGAARYIQGDIAVAAGVAYVALRYNRNKPPESSPEDWALVPEPVYPAWADIEDGSVILEGVIVLEGGSAWLCISQHLKSTVYKPKSGSSKWSKYEP